MLTLTHAGWCSCCAFPTTLSGARRSTFVCEPAEAAASVADARPRTAASSSAPAKALQINGGTIVDPRTGNLIPCDRLLVRDGRIIALNSFDADASAIQVNAAGKYIVPGYNDMHSHVLELADPSGALALMLAEGVTGFRQMSGSPELLQKRRSGNLPIGECAPALLELPGTILTPLNGSSDDAVCAEVRAQKALGADFIKVGMLAPPVFEAALAESKAIGIPILGHLQEGVDAAASIKGGFRSVEHLGPGATVWTACSSEEETLRADVQPLRLPTLPLKLPFIRALIMARFQTMLINPAAFVKPAYTIRLQRAMDTFDPVKAARLAEVFIDAGSWQVPTLVRLKTQYLADSDAYALDPYLRFMPEKKVRSWRKVTKRFANLPAEMRRTFAEAYPRQLMLTKVLSDCGVRMLAGTDGGWLSGPGLTLKEEFAELASAGLSALQILQMATTNAADYLGEADRMGRVAEGYNADFLLLDGNPLVDVANLQKIAGVVRAGRLYSIVNLRTITARIAATRGTLASSD